MRPPVHPIRVDIPFRPSKEILPNGATLVCLPIPTEQLLRVDICFPGGKALQATPLQAQFALSQMGEGSRRYPPARVAERLDFFSATLTPICNYRLADLSLVCLPRFLPRILPILHSLLDEPSYGRGRLRQAMEVAKTNWLIARQKVDKVANEALFVQMFGSTPGSGGQPLHPMARRVEEQHFAQVTPTLLRDYHEEHFCASLATIFLTGAIDTQGQQLVRGELGAEPWGGSHPVSPEWPPMPPVPQGPVGHVEPLPSPTVQSAIRIAFFLPPLHHADMPVLRIANTLLGGYFGSRLMSNIREDKGFTYHIGSRILQCPGEGCLLAIGTEVGSDVTWQAVDEIYKEIQRMADDLVPDAEMALVKNYLCGRACRQYEAHIDIADLLISLHYSGRDIDQLLAEHQAMQAATAEDVRRQVRQYLSPQCSVYCVAGTTPPRP